MATQAILTTDKAIITTGESQNAIPNSLKQIEKRAQALVDNWHSACTKLADQRNEVETIQEAFDELGPGETILECRSFKMFCIRWLKRHPSSVYKMLAKARLQDADPDADESMDESEDTNLSGVNITDDDVPELDETDDEPAAEGSSEDDDGEKEEDTSTATTKSSSKSTQKRVNRPTANRAICTDFTKQIIPILLNAPTDATKEQVHDKAREQAILFAEDYPELVAELRLPDGFNLKPRITQLEEQIDQLKAEHEVAKQELVENFRQRIEAIGTVPEHLRDETITATLLAEPDIDQASEILTAYLRTVAERVLPPEMEMRQPKPFKFHEADGHVTATVAIKGRDYRIMVGDWLEKKGVDEDPATLAKCTAVGECEQRRRVREWDGSKWGKEHVVYWGGETGEEKSYRVISETRAREIAPAALGSAESSAAEGSPVVNPAPQEAEEPTA
jgi:hypothetical protein